jgi:hypothetical protein
MINTDFKESDELIKLKWRMSEDQCANVEIKSHWRKIVIKQHKTKATTALILEYVNICYKPIGK